MNQIAADHVAFYEKREATLKGHAARLLDLYTQRKLKNTPTSDALWAGYSILREELERNSTELAKWREWVKKDGYAAKYQSKADEVTA